ncbi:hypothetical protein WAI453_002696 [Rhynchosporium graminicola]
MKAQKERTITVLDLHQWTLFISTLDRSCSHSALSYGVSPVSRRSRRKATTQLPVASYLGRSWLAWDIRFRRRRDS